MSETHNISGEEQHGKQNLFQPVGEAVEEVEESLDRSVPESQSGNHQENGDAQDLVRTTEAADAMGHPVQEIESLCMNCHEDGVTRLLLTTIPYFREVVIMSFECPHCGFKNSEIQPASSIQEKGAKYVLKIENREDFNRQVIKSETATCKFVELDIEIPAKRGQLTTVEGLLSEMIDDLKADQAARKSVDENLYERIEEFMQKVKSYIDCEPGTLPLTLIVDDPAGNSWIEYKPGEPLHKWSRVEYLRTDDQNVEVGIITKDQLEDRRKEKLAELSQRDRNPSQTVSVGSTSRFLSDATDIENFSNEVQTFRGSCPSCMHECETHMKPVNIPHFKEVIIMSTVCEHCGFKSNEVKTGGAIPEKGRKITLYCDDPADLSRDILKSESCSMTIPELSVEIQQGTLGGRFTTLEGIIKQVYEELESRVFSQTSDSMDEQTKERWLAFFRKLKDALEGKVKFHVIMDDPLAGSYIQNVYAPDADPNMKIEDYERTKEQSEDYGLNDMVVDQ